MTSPEVHTQAQLSGQSLRPHPLRQLLASWEPQPGQAASSLYLPPKPWEQLPQSRHEGGSRWAAALEGLGESVLDSDTGLVGLESGDRGLVVLPPFPVADERLVPEWDTAPLMDLLEVNYTIGVVLVRLGRHSVAVYQGDRLASSKTDSRYVKGRHRAGGSSQRRFERIREGQARKLFDQVCGNVQAQFSPYADRLDYVFLGGDRFTLQGLLKVCPYLSQLQPITLSRRINVRDPKRDTLEEVGQMLRESRVYSVEFPTKG